MSISSIYPRKTMTNRTRLQSMAKPHKYDQKAEKTKDGELVSSYMCSPESAAEEFEISKRLYYQLTGRSQPKARDVLMYRIIQSFKPGEVTPEQANEIAQHEAAKKAFDALNGKPIPKVAQLSEEYGRLLAEKQAEYERYRAYRQDMLTYETAKQNVDRILGLELPEKARQAQQQMER